MPAFDTSLASDNNDLFANITPRKKADECRRSLLYAFDDVFDVNDFPFSYVLNSEFQELRVKVLVIGENKALHPNPFSHNAEQVVDAFLLGEIVLRN